MNRISENTREAIMADLICGDLSNTEIAMKHGVGIMTVSRIGGDLGINRRGRPKGEHPSTRAAFYLECAIHGMSQSEIARLAGVTQGCVRSTLVGLQQKGYPVPRKIFGMHRRSFES